MSFTSLKCKLLTPSAKLPVRSGDAVGYDLFADSVRYDDFCKQKFYGTGLAIEIPFGYVGLIFPRSSICNADLRLSNCVGVIDPDYRGEIKVVFDLRNNESYHPNHYEIENKIAQLVIVPCVTPTLIEVDELSTTARGEGGFGSTGK